MDKSKFSKIFPDLPRGIGLSKQFLWVMIVGLLVLMILFLYFLHHYQPQPMAIKKQRVQINPSEAVSMIEAIRSQPRKHEPVYQLHREARQNSVQANPEDQAFLKAAARSSISVYHQTNHRGSDFGPSSNNAFSHTDAGLRMPQNMHANLYKEQNQQTEKSSFLSGAAKTTSAMIHSQTQVARSPYTLYAGTILPATLETGINSDLPGTIIAKVRRDVFDSVTGNYLLVPQGSTLIGTYDSQVAYGQKRVLIVWSRLIFPNGISQNLEGQQGVDLMGLAGLHDKVDNHYVRLFGSALMFSVFGAAAQLSQPQATGTTLSPSQIVAGAVGQQLSQTGAQMVAKNMNIQPTLNIRPGANFNVLLARDLILPSPYGVVQ